MDFKRHIKFLNPKLLLITIVALLFLNNPMKVYADDTDYTGWASSIVNGTGSSNTGGNSVIQNGVSYTRTGYLCYLLTKDGADTGLHAVAFKSPGFSALPGTEMRITSRRGHTVSSFLGVAPWNVTPWAEGGSPTHAHQIKEYFRGMTGNSDNGVQFVYDNWGYEATTEYYNGNYVIVIETLMHFQFSKPSDGLSNGELWVLAEELVDTIYGGEGGTKRLLEAAIDWGYENILDRWDSYKDAQQLSVITSIKQLLTSALVNELEATVGAGARTFVGPPLIGTVPNLIDFKNSTDPSMTVFDSYLNKVAPIAERIEYDEAGFIAYTGSTSNKLPDSSILGNNGVAMLIIHANTTAQTTCDEPLQPAPHRPPVESEGTYTIVKNYRTLLEDGTTYQEDGCHSQGDLGSNILIENELEYQVVGWKITNTTNTGISSIDWNPPGSVQGNNGSGTTPTSVTIEPTYTCLYVLLEKVESEPPEEEPWNYNLTQSQITRRVWFSEPDKPLTNMSGDYKIDTKPFRWIANAHDGCDTHNHEYQGPCSGHKQDCDCSGVCASPCTKKTTDPAHVCTKCTTDHTTWCDDKNNCVENTLYATCGLKEGWKWIDNALTLSINNTLQNTYPYQDVLATKEGWNAETTVKNIIKYFHNGGEVYRKDDMIHKDEQFPQDGSEGETGWDYVCVLMRGKDKITLAEWQNYGQGNNAANNANDDLRDASPSGFTVANTDSGTRKTVDYYETFNTFFDRDEEEGNVCR